MRIPRTSFVSNSLLLSCDAALAAILTAAFWLLAARLLPAAEVGTASTMVAASSLIALFSRLGFDYAIPYFLPNHERPERVVEAAFLLGGLSALVGSLIFICSLNFWLPQLRFLQEWPWMLVFLVSTLSLVWINFCFALGIAQQKVPWIIAQDIVQNGARLALWYFVFRLSGLSGGQGLFLAFAISAAASAILGLFVLLPPGAKLRSTLDRTALVGVGGYAAGSYGTALLATTPEFLMPIIVTSILGSASTAVFSVCLMAVSAVGILNSAAISVTFAEGSRSKETLADRFPNIMYFIWGYMAVCFVLAYYLGHFALGLFGAEYAEKGFGLLLLLLAAKPIVALNDFTVVLQRIYRKLRTVYVLFTLLAVGWVIISALTLRVYGLNAAGISYLLIQALVALGGFFFVRPHPLKKSSL